MIRTSTLAAILVISIGNVGLAHAVTPLPPKYRQLPAAAPEIDPASAASALTLLAGGLAVFGRRRNKR